MKLLLAEDGHILWAKRVGTLINVELRGGKESSCTICDLLSKVQKYRIS